ncbi:MAG: hypothetical protein WBM44_31225 [Waterburya sp.]
MMLIKYVKHGFNAVDNQFNRFECLKKHKIIRYVLEIIILVTIIPSPETFALWGTVAALIAL